MEIASCLVTVLAHASWSADPTNSNCLFGGGKCFVADTGEVIVKTWGPVGLF